MTSESQESCTQDRLQALLSECNKSVAHYSFSGDREHLEYMVFQIDQALGHPRRAIEANAEWDIIKNLLTGQDQFDRGEARDAVKAYQGLWSAVIPEDRVAAVTDKALPILATGLRDGVLDEYPILSEDRYQQFINMFCTIVEGVDPKSLSEAKQDRAILTAYKAARGSAVSDIDPSVVPEATIEQCKDEVLMTELEENIKMIQVLIDSFSDRIISISTQHPRDFFMPSLNDRVPYQVSQAKASLSSARELLIKARSRSAERLKMLCNVRSQNTLDETESSEEDLITETEESDSGSGESMETEEDD
ncbi:unnamed protein product [Clonostachys rosea]|uniref:GED domain-containing protein n=1 Tax=Bionectria ochroleuca TaxID=29856 RepID=A0ABY6U247_BIOOC|nr:unnamed protein product [Clonostachys rosea]